MNADSFRESGIVTSLFSFGSSSIEFDNGMY